MKRTLIAIACIFSFAHQLSASDTQHPIEIQKSGKTDICNIGNIDDGDTFDLNCRGGHYSDVRLIGVNTPDYNHHTEKGNCFYNEAKEYIRERKENTYKVTFYGNDLCKDPYKGCRNLVQLVDLKNNADIGQMMILRGFAFSWTNFSIIPTNIRSIYDRMEYISSMNNLGLWSQCHVVSTPIMGMDSSIPTRMTESSQENQSNI